MKTGLMLWSILLVSLAGCTSEGPVNLPKNESETISAPPAQTNESARPSNLPNPLGDTIRMEGCVGTQSGHTWAPGSNPGTVPPSWEPADELFLPTTQLLILECHRFASQNIERPVQLILEGHSRAAFPEACIEFIDGRLPLVAQHMWANDTEIAAHLSSWTNTTVGIASVDIHQSEAPQDPHVIQAIINGETSTFTIVDEGQRSDSPPSSEIWFWPGANDVVYGTLEYDGSKPMTTEREALVEARPPLLLAEEFQPTITDANTLQDMNLEWTRGTYDTLDCT